MMALHSSQGVKKLWKIPSNLRFAKSKCTRVGKGGSISEGFSLWLKKRCQITTLSISSLKSYGFKEGFWKDCEDPTRSCQHLNFGAAEHTSVKAKHWWSNVVFSSLAEWAPKFKFLYTYRMLSTYILRIRNIGPLVLYEFWFG